MPETIQDTKRAILEKGIQKILEESGIPKRMHLQMVQALKKEIEEYRSALDENKTAHNQTLAEAEERFKKIEDLYGKANDFLDILDAEVDRLTSIEHLKGDPGKPGKDAKPVNIQAVIEGLKPFIPEPIPGDPGKPGENAEVDIETLTTEIVQKIKDDKLIEITDIRNSQSFLFNKKRYKFEELMRGAGGGTTSGGQLVTTQYLLTALQSGLDITIDLTQLTNWSTFDQLIAVYRNNVPQTAGLNFTVSGSTVTIFNADASEIFNITYAYT